MSWWNPFSWTPAGEPGAPDEDAGIWGGAGGPGGLHAGMVLGEGSVVQSVPINGPYETEVPTDIAIRYGTVGGTLRAVGAGVELSESAWRAFAETPVGTADPGGGHVGVDLSEPELREDAWAKNVAGRRFTR